MTRRDFILKWLFYAVAFTPVWLLERFFLNRFPVLGAAPMLHPLAVAAVAVLEGPLAGGGFGLAVGILCDAAAYGLTGGLTVGLCFAGVAAGIISQYVLKQSFAGCFICSAGTLVLLDAGRILTGAAQGYPLAAMAAVALPEILWSLVFTWPVYLLFRFVHRRTQVSTLF